MMRRILAILGASPLLQREDDHTRHQSGRRPAGRCGRCAGAGTGGRAAADELDRLLPIAAAGTGALLTADAWFDVLTSSPGWNEAEAIAMSLLAELPLAFTCFWLAGTARR
jgi:hypothetical protein